MQHLLIVKNIGTFTFFTEYNPKMTVIKQIMPIKIPLPVLLKVSPYVVNLSPNF